MAGMGDRKQKPAVNPRAANRFCPHVTGGRLNGEDTKQSLMRKP